MGYSFQLARYDRVNLRFSLCRVLHKINYLSLLLSHFHHNNSIYKITTTLQEVKEEICRRMPSNFFSTTQFQRKRKKLGLLSIYKFSLPIWVAIHDCFVWIFMDGVYCTYSERKCSIARNMMTWEIICSLMSPCCLLSAQTSPSPTHTTSKSRALHLKGQCHEIFYFWFFSWISFSQAPENTIRAVSNFFEKFAEIFVA